MIRKILKFFGWIFLATLMLTIGIGLFSDKDPTTTTSSISWEKRDDSAVALSKAQTEVKKHLKAPSTAKWPGMFESAGHVVALPGQRYLITSWVDSQNDFGAMVRTKYQAAVVQKEKNLWEVTEIQVEQ